MNRSNALMNGTSGVEPSERGYLVHLLRRIALEFYAVNSPCVRPGKPVCGIDRGCGVG
jgi:hypothetical protein